MCIITINKIIKGENGGENLKKLKQTNQSKSNTANSIHISITILDMLIESSVN
jgi:hypothetical protein